jgi:NAD(P)-dependent dehydrogenase (short-subunit alcohol dehydrogenase family)
MKLNNESVAVITGAGSGIGRALSNRLASDGVRGLVISDVNMEGLDETAELLKKYNTEVITLRCDVSQLSEIEKLRDTALDRFGIVSHLFNNAGVGLVGRTEEVSFADMQWLFDINFWGTVYGTKLFLPVFRKQDFGDIINISSIFAFISPPGQSAYCASKSAVQGFTECVRHELAGTNINAFCVHPGGIKTSIAKDARKGENAPIEDVEKAPIIFEKITFNTAETAADTIVDGVNKGKVRILIGRDAIQVSAVQRLFPKRYFKILDWLSGGMLSEFK